MHLEQKKRTFFVKSRFLATQEELEALLWICFTSRMTLLIFEEKIFFGFFFVEKKSDEKNLGFFVDIFKLAQLENVPQKIEIFFFVGLFFDEKKFKKYFFVKNQKHHS